MTIKSEMFLDDKNRFLMKLIGQSTRVPAKVRWGSPRSKFFHPNWWSSGCVALNESQMKLFRVFRRHGGTVNFNAYRLVNEELTELCEKLTPDSFKQYCFIFNCHSSLKECIIWPDGIVRFNFGVMWVIFPGFPNSLDDTSFVTPRLSSPGCQTSEVNWFVEQFTIEELESVLGLCKNSSPGIDNVIFAPIAPA
jgi:hypothetical protein